jgi:hypothetical protein
MAKTKTKKRIGRRRVWLVNMLDGTWAVSCQRCGFLGRGPQPMADQVAGQHVCR